jgi:hypothetical protein
MRRIVGAAHPDGMSQLVGNSVHTSAQSRLVTWNRRRYWIATGLLCTMFIVSPLLTFIDPEGTRRATTDLGYPAYIGMYPLAFAKLAAVFAILWRRSSTLVMFAFAGLLYDLLLALSAHIHENDFPYGWLAVFGLVIWCAAFWVERDRVAHEAHEAALEAAR